MEFLRRPDCPGVTIRAAVDPSILLFLIVGRSAPVFRSSLTWTVTSFRFPWGPEMGVLFARLFLRDRAVTRALDAGWEEPAIPRNE